MIGKLEELVLLAVSVIGPKATPAAVHKRICMGHKATMGAVYTTMLRLAQKAYLDRKSVGKRADTGPYEFSLCPRGHEELQLALRATEIIGHGSPLVDKPKLEICA